MVAGNGDGVRETHEYTVEVYERGMHGQAVAQDGAHRISANSALSAAARLLAESLSPIGDVTTLRAKVWRVEEGGNVLTTLLYRRN